MTAESTTEMRARLKAERESSELTLRLVRQIVEAPAIKDRKARDLLRTLLALPAPGRTYGAARAAKIDRPETAEAPPCSLT